MQEIYGQKTDRQLAAKQRIIAVAAGREKADLVLKNAKYLNVFSNEFLCGDIAVANGLIAGVGKYDGKTEIDVSGKLVLPGFIDAHIHLESSMVTPAEFAKAVVAHGTTTVITDPHEITNVMGIDGVEYMIQASQNLPIDVHFMMPSCVPATEIDESGAELDCKDIDLYLDNKKVLGLAEMMNYVGVINGDKNVLSKIVTSQAHHKKIDGHAPELSGNDLNAYIAAGVYSDHECSTFENALEKLRKGQFIMIREGTAAHNLKALMPLLTQQYYSRCMFATDDKHPSDLLYGGHIDYIVKQALKNGADPIVALKTATHHAARYFLLNNKGAIASGYLADIVVVDNLEDFNVETVFKCGKLVFDGEVKDFSAPTVDEKLAKKCFDTFHLDSVTPSSFKVDGKLGLIGLVGGELLTRNLGTADKIDVENDILKIACIERHKGTNHIGVGYVKGYSLKSGAVATSVAHDSHNIITVGCNDDDIADAVNAIKDSKGGIAVVENGKIKALLELPIAGLMSDEPLTTVNEKLENAKSSAYEFGADKSIDPFMTLSFLSLPVIPSLRITTKGVFDVENWKML
ncbi:adenine deaminase [Ruminococcus bromii]|uniref:adenine deaminase n=1 Tax=Ruminococcus bromii TaxID=40518 RepID=UPI002E7A50CE|nr:adenine deaminase [Ruminococcus bromii]MEE0609085.1 adenine deaminase [Ruminococcus bromii]